VLCSIGLVAHLAVNYGEIGLFGLCWKRYRFRPIPSPRAEQRRLVWVEIA
jgi:hypothetical protein